jgi:hypothetical protein
VSRGCLCSARASGEWGHQASPDVTRRHQVLPGAGQGSATFTFPAPAAQGGCGSRGMPSADSGVQPGQQQTGASCSHHAPSTAPAPPPHAPAAAERQQQQHNQQQHVDQWRSRQHPASGGCRVTCGMAVPCLLTWRCGNATAGDPLVLASSWVLFENGSAHCVHLCICAVGSPARGHSSGWAVGLCEVVAAVAMCCESTCGLC